MGALLTAWKIKCIKIALFSMISHAISTNTKCWRKEVSVTVRLEISWDHIPLWLLIMLQQHQHLTITNKWHCGSLSIFPYMRSFKYVYGMSRQWILCCPSYCPSPYYAVIILLQQPCGALVESTKGLFAGLVAHIRKGSIQKLSTRQQFISSFSCMLQKSSIWKDESS